MSRKRCVRKHWMKVNPIELAIAGVTTTPEDALDTLRFRELAAIESFAKGVARPEDFRDLCDMLNLAETLARMGVGPEVLQACEEAEQALLRAKDRYEESGHMAFTGPGLTAMRDLFDYHDLQRTSIDRSTYEKAIAATRNRIRSAHPSVKVLT